MYIKKNATQSSTPGLLAQITLQKQTWQVIRETLEGKLHTVHTTKIFGR